MQLKKCLLNKQVNPFVGTWGDVYPSLMNNYQVVPNVKILKHCATSSPSWDVEKSFLDGKIGHVLRSIKRACVSSCRLHSVPGSLRRRRLKPDRVSAKGFAAGKRADLCSLWKCFENFHGLQQSLCWEVKEWMSWEMLEGCCSHLERGWSSSSGIWEITLKVAPVLVDGWHL